MAKTNGSDQIFPETRWLAGLVIPFLVAAFGILFIFPTETERLFAWKIRPSMSAMMLGAAYAGGIYFFANVLRSKHWHKVKVGFLPVTVFASLLGIATLLHWDRFTHGHISFIAWAGLYFTAPFIVFAIWLRNRGQDTGEPDTDFDVVLSSPARLLMGVFGVITLGFSIYLFAQPAIMIALWPWELTPLTARVMGAMFSLPALVGLGIAVDTRWSVANIILQSQGFSIFLILIAILFTQQDFDWSTPGSWLFTFGLGGMLLSIVVLVAIMQAKHRNIIIDK